MDLETHKERKGLYIWGTFDQRKLLLEMSDIVERDLYHNPSKTINYVYVSLTPTKT